MGIIYKITNTQNGKNYIGKTSRNLRVRWYEHKQEARLGNSNIPLYNAMNKYGMDNFKICVLEDNIPTEQLNEREKYYISLYQSRSHEKGYNVTIGGDGGQTARKLTDTQIQEIIGILSDKNNLESFTSIGKQYGVSPTTIESINNGILWRNNNLTYPIRKYNVVGLTLDRKTYAEIVDLLQNSVKSMQEICKIYNLTESKITSINNGKYCYSNHPYYEGIYNGDFPIRKTNQLTLTKEQFIPILYDIIFTNLSMEKIGAPYNIKGNTITYIANGKRRLDLTSGFITPIRKNLKQNQEIFNTLFPDFEGGD